MNVAFPARTTCVVCLVELPFKGGDGVLQDSTRLTKNEGSFLCAYLCVTVCLQLYDQLSAALGYFIRFVTRGHLSPEKLRIPEPVHANAFLLFPGCVSLIIKTGPRQCNPPLLHA